MISFVSKQFIEENPYNDNMILVVDVDLNGVWEYGYHEKLRLAFPRVYDIYRHICFKELNKLGSAVIIQEGGYKVALLVTKKNRNDSQEEALKNFEKALAHLLYQVSSETSIYSPIMGRKDRLFGHYSIVISKLIKPLNFNWVVYTTQKGKSS